MNISENKILGSELEQVRIEEYVSCPLRNMDYLIRFGQKPEQAKGADTTLEVLIKKDNYRDLVVLVEFYGLGSSALFMDVYEADISIDFSKVEIQDRLGSKRTSFWASVISRDEFDHPLHLTFVRILGGKAVMAAEQVLEETDENE